MPTSTTAIATSRRPARIAALAAIALAAGAFLGLAAAQPASAHDELVSSTPEPGQVFETAPAEVKLSFSDEVIPVGTAIVVVDHHGEEVEVGETTVSGTDVTAALPAALEGEYQVRWRAVSSDGHVIDGTIDFGVGEGATGAWTEEPPHEASGDHADGDDHAEGHDEAATTDAATGPDGWTIAGIVLGIVGIAALGAAIAVLVRASRQRRDGSGE
ncbi:copper resistance CopC family protein [Agromyces soli]